MNLTNLNQIDTFTVLRNYNTSEYYLSFLISVPSANVVWRHCGVLCWQIDAVAGKCVNLIIHVCLHSCVGVGACETGAHLIFPCMPFPFSSVLLT